MVKPAPTMIVVVAEIDGRRAKVTACVRDSGGGAQPAGALPLGDLARACLDALAPCAAAASAGADLRAPVAPDEQPDPVRQFRAALLDTLPALDAGTDVNDALAQLSARLSALPEPPPESVAQRFCDLFALAFGRLAEQHLDVEDVPAAGADAFGIRVRLRTSECAAAALRAVDADLFGSHGGSPDPMEGAGATQPTGEGEALQDRTPVCPIVVCAFEEGAVAITPELWAAALEQRARLGRPLDGDDLRQLADLATAPGAGFSVEGEPFSWFADPHRSPVTPDPIADAGDASLRAAARTWEAVLSFRRVPGK